MKIPELQPDAFTWYVDESSYPEKNYARDQWDHMAAFCVRAFQTEHPSLDSGPLQGGFRVLSRLLKFAAVLYQDPSQPTDCEGPAAIYDLQGILLESSDTLRRFAELPGVTNSVVEDYFGLARGGTPDNLADLYHFEQNTAPGTLFIADNDHFARAVAEGRAQDLDYDPATRCPMAQITQRDIWPRLVHFAGEAPQLFPRTLGVQ